MTQIKRMEIVPRKAIMKKTKAYRIPKLYSNLKKGEEVFILERPIGKGRFSYTAARKIGDSLEYDVIRSEFEYVEEETFMVSVTRISHSTKSICVKAKDRKEAERLAIEKAGNLEFSEQDAEYHTNGAYTKQQCEHYGFEMRED